MEKSTRPGTSESSYIPVNLVYSTFEPEATRDVSQPPFILIHGLTSCRGTWSTIPQLLANVTNRKAYAFDARNHGDSDWSDAFTMDILVRDLLNFMDSIKVAKAILIGHSMGGTTALKTALKAPERVEMLIVEEMSVNMPPLTAFITALAYIELAPKAVEMIPRDFDEIAATNFIMNYVFRSLRPDKAEIPSRSRVDFSTMAMRKGADGRFELKANMAVLQKSLRNAVVDFAPPDGSYDGPACFIYGELSNFHVAKDSDTILKYFPRANIVGIENAWHTVHTDKPPEFLQAVLEFVLSDGNSKSTPHLCEKNSEMLPDKLL